MYRPSCRRGPFALRVGDPPSCRSYNRCLQSHPSGTSTRGAMVFEGVNPPKEPANYNPQNKYKDPVAYFQHREAAVAQKFVHIAEAKLIRTKLRECYRNSGVNYITDCKELAQSYLEAIKGVGVSRANEGPTDPASWD